MDDIKEKFIEAVINELDKNERYISMEKRYNIADIRWDWFVTNFINSEEVQKYVLGNW